MAKDRICPVCGEHFKSWHKAYTCSPECSKVYRKWFETNRYREKKGLEKLDMESYLAETGKNPDPKPKPGKQKGTLSARYIQAKAEGCTLSYGQWVERQRQEAEGRIPKAEARPRKKEKIAELETGWDYFKMGEQRSI